LTGCGLAGREPDEHADKAWPGDAAAHGEARIDGRTGDLLLKEQIVKLLDGTGHTPV